MMARGICETCGKSASSSKRITAAKRCKCPAVMDQYCREHEARIQAHMRRVKREMPKSQRGKEL